MTDHSQSFPPADTGPDEPILGRHETIRLKSDAADRLAHDCKKRREAATLPTAREIFLAFVAADPAPVSWSGNYIKRAWEKAESMADCLRE